LTDVKAQLKKGVVSPHIIPDVAIVDPSLTLSAPPAITASTGMDAMTHCIEAYTNRHSHPMVDAFALEGIRLIAENLETAVIDGANLGARSAMALGSMYGGLCLGPVNTAAVHALAYPLGGTYHVPHGVSNSMLLPFVMDFNLPSCSDKYAHVARLLGVTDDCASDELARRGIQRIGRLAAECGIPKSLKELDIPETALPSMAASAMEVKRLLDNNPRPVTATDAEAIFRAAYQGVVDEGAV
jgi:alcohol dehydrogenase class IV